MKIIILRAVVQSWNFNLLDYIDGEAGKLENLGFHSVKRIPMKTWGKKDKVLTIIKQPNSNAL